MHPDDRGMIAQQISDWVREHVVGDKPEFGRCESLILRHMSIANRVQGDVGAFIVPKDEGLIGEIDMIINKIVDSAQRHSDNMASGLQKYGLYAYYTKDKHYVPHTIFRVAAQDDTDLGNIEPSEPPTQAGIISQLMRHNEATMKNSVMKDSYLFSIMQRELSRLSDKDERSQQQTLDMMALMQDMTNEGHTRRLKERKEEADIILRENLFEQLKTLLPIIANRVAGKPIFPEEDKSFLLMGTLLENLRPDQQAFLRDGLDERQTALLAEILAEYEKKKHERLSTTRDTLPSVTKGLTPTTNELPPMLNDNELPAPTPQIFSKVRERMGNDEESTNPRIRGLEQHSQRFASRLTEPLKPKKD